MVGLEPTPTRVGEVDRFAPNSSATAALPSNLSFSYRDAGIFTQAEFPREDSSTPPINRTPATPSSTPGTRSDAGADCRPASLALICSAKSV